MSCPDPILATVLNSDLCLPQTESHPYKWKKWPLFGKFIVMHLPKMIWWTLLENDWYEGYILCIFSPRDPCLLIICSTCCLLPPAWATTKLSPSLQPRNKSAKYLRLRQIQIELRVMTGDSVDTSHPPPLSHHCLMAHASTGENIS